MDWSRSCYESYMRLFHDGEEVLVHGRWHFCPDDAVVVPYYHAFASSVWDADGADIEEKIGEVSSYRKWWRGSRSPRILGQNWCGARELWEQGSPLALRGTMPVDPEGLPLCCISGPMTLLELNAGGAGGATLVVPTELRAGGVGGAWMPLLFTDDGAEVVPQAQDSGQIALGFDDDAEVTPQGDESPPVSDDAEVIPEADESPPVSDDAEVIPEAQDS